MKTAQITNKELIEVYHTFFEMSEKQVMYWIKSKQVTTKSDPNEVVLASINAILMFHNGNESEIDLIVK